MKINLKKSIFTGIEVLLMAGCRFNNGNKANPDQLFREDLGRTKYQYWAKEMGCISRFCPYPRALINNQCITDKIP